MKKKILLTVGLLAVLALLAVGCSMHTKGMDDIRLLSDTEQDYVIDIALSTPAAVAALEEYDVYTTQLRWVAMYWYGKNAVTWWLSYDTAESGLPEDMPEGVEFYSEVIIKFGEPAQEELRVAINPDTGKIVYTAAAE
jgi:hypothetical protein